MLLIAGRLAKNRPLLQNTCFSWNGPHSGNPDFTDGMRRPVSSGMRYAPNDRRAQGATERRPAMKKTITVQAFKSEIFKEQKLTIGLDLGDRWSFYCVLDEAGQVLLEQK